MFIAIGHTPTTAIFARPGGDGRGGLHPDRAGQHADLASDGVFAAGDVQDKVFRQAVTAAGTGCMAALEAEKWLAEHGHARRSPRTSRQSTEWVQYRDRRSRKMI